mmetsp:Transcript_82169/g.190806  ORF Transcript_82169/g.190806 Transcript_82169/m.190806 type:complete len:427 (+) Transcript_82169:39-1319(+)
MAFEGAPEKKAAVEEGTTATRTVLLPPAGPWMSEELGQAQRWKASSMKHVVLQSSHMLLKLQPEQRPKTREKLASLLALRIKRVKIFAFRPEDVARDLLKRGSISANHEALLLEWLQDSEPSAYTECLPPEKWPEGDGVMYVWRTMKVPDLPTAGLAHWICDTAYVSEKVNTEELVNRLVGNSHERLAFEAQDGENLEAAGEPRIFWKPNIPKPLKGPLSVQAALLISLPETCPAYDTVQQVRKKHDPAFERWMPHINLFYPFLPASQFQLPAIRRKLQSEGAAPFELRLRDIGELEHPGSVTFYLKPDEESEKHLQRLHEQLVAALPELPKDKAKGKGKGKGKGRGRGRAPPSREGEEDHDPEAFLPHMTVGKQGKGADSIVTEIKETLKAIGEGGACFRVEHVSLCERTDDTPFEEVAKLPLVT